MTTRHPRATPVAPVDAGAEERRLAADAARGASWKRWGPYLAERQWSTVREDYSPHGECWDYLSHDHARSRAYRWGEDGLLGITDRQCRLAFALALWNEHDPILKERLFGLTGPEGNHGEDVKECYFYLDSTPTHSYLKSLYKYPQSAFPYAQLVEENRRRGRDQREFELVETGAFDGDRYFDVFAEYAKGAPNDILIRITIHNRGKEAAPIHVLPTVWFRNTWSWGRSTEGHGPKPRLSMAAERAIQVEHHELRRMRLAFDVPRGVAAPEVLFTENETNTRRLFGVASESRYVKDAFHEAVVSGHADAVNPGQVGTKAAPHYRMEIPAGGKVVLRLRLSAEDEAPVESFGPEFDQVFEARIREADAFYDSIHAPEMTPEERNVARQGYAGLLFNKQFFHYVVRDWIEGDPAHPKPPRGRERGRNSDWHHFHARDVIAMPDKWEYPWFAAWDLAFHMIPFSKVDPYFAKSQLLLFLREWFMHPNGQLPAYEFAFGDVNPPVHAWAVWRVYKITGERGKRDRAFLRRAFDKLVINFTWWVNRKDAEGKHLFGGGFLGLDNIGVFDRSQPLPTGGYLEQADGTAWMAFYCSTMLAMALELAQEDPVYEDMASKFFEHFVAITDAMNNLGGTGLWDEEDGFYYDQLHANGQHMPLRTRSMVGLMPLVAVEVLEDDLLEKLPGFSKRMHWFLENREDLGHHISYLCTLHDGPRCQRLLAIPSRERLERILHKLLDESEFLSPCGIRSLSRVHKDKPYRLDVNGSDWRVDYVSGEGTSGLFGGNSNWRGPVWFPVNYLIIEALERYHHFYGDALLVECPTGSGQRLDLFQVAQELKRRLASIFLPDAEGRRPNDGGDRRFAEDPHWRELVLFHEYFDGDTGRGLGANHFASWTSLVVRCVDDVARGRRGRGDQTG
jgi:hypothetical protein